MGFTLGMKFQTYEDDKHVVFRVINVKNQDTAVCEKTNGDTFTISAKELYSSKYIAITNDAFVNFTITSTNDGLNDIYVGVNKTSNVDKCDLKPHLIARQDMYSVHKNVIDLSSEIYVGDCFNKYDDGNDAMASCMEFKNIDSMIVIATYVEDKLEDILKCLGHRATKINKILKNMHDANKNDLIKGYCENIEEFLKYVDFMYHYRRIFNIYQIDFPIILKDSSGKPENIVDGKIKLNNKQIHRIENIIRKHTSQMIVLEYDRDIDIANIIKYSHIMVSDTTDSIFLIAFIATRDFEVDADIMNAMNPNKHLS